MQQEEFRGWLSCVDELTAAQRDELLAVLSGRTAESASAAVELGVGEDRRCPRCGSPGAVSMGRSRGLRRCRCKSCGRTFNAATGTPLSGLHRKEQRLSRGETVRTSADRCGVAVSTAFRWRRRFLEAVEMSPDKLKGIVEADETFFLESRKGERDPDREPRRRGGKASKRGLSAEQVPVLAAADRGGSAVSAVLPKVSADALAKALEPVVDKDIVLVSDSNPSCPPCAAALGMRHERLNLSAGERARAAFHIRTVNSRHSQLKDFLRLFRGISTRYLDSCLRWFHLSGLADPANPRACLQAAMKKSIRIDN